MKNISVFLCICAVCLGISGCGDKNDKYIVKDEENASADITSFSEPDSDILPKRFEYINYGGIVPEGYEGKVHDNTEYPPEMFWGNWVLKSFNGKEMDSIEIEEKIVIEDDLAAECFPNEMRLGYESSEINTGMGFAGFLPGYAEFTSLPGSGRRDIVFDTSKDTISIGILQYNDGEIFYGKECTEADVLKEIDYAFVWNGWELTLAYEGQTATYVPWQISDENQGMPSMGIGNLMFGYEAFEDIQDITLFVPSDQDYNATISFLADDSQKLNEYFAELVYSPKGDVSIHILPDNSILSDGAMNDARYEAKFFYSGNAFTLVDGDVKSIYCTYASRYADKLQENVESELLKELEENQLAELARRQNVILEKIQSTFQKAGFQSVIDENTGRITLDANILFGYDDAALSDEGKNLLNRFIGAYVPAVLDEECAGYISEVIIEGHTDTQGGYDYNLELSNSRAEAVADYFETTSNLENISESMWNEFIQKMVVEGKSFENPIYNTDGTVDMEASRRVTFRFTLKVDE